MTLLSLHSPDEIIRGIAGRARRRRLDLGLTQAELSARSGVALGTLKAFERTGGGSLQTVVLLAFALGGVEEFTGLFPDIPYRTIDEVIERPRRQRGRRRKPETQT